MIFDLNEGVNVMEEEATSEFFDSLEDIELDTNLEDAILLSNYVGIKADSMYNKLMEAVAISELEAVQESGSTIIYEGAMDRVKAFFEKAKAFFKKVAEYIKAFFKKVFTMVKALFLDGEKFWKAEGQYVKAGWDNKDTDDWKFTGYKYSDNINGVSFPEFEKAITRDEYKSVKEAPFKFAGSIVASVNSFAPYKFTNVYDYNSIADARKVFFSTFRDDGKDLTHTAAKVVVKKEYKVKDVYSVKKLEEIITNYSVTKKTLDADYKAASEQISSAIKAIESLRKEAEDFASKDENKTEVSKFVVDYNVFAKANNVALIKTSGVVDAIMKASSFVISTQKDLQKLLNAFHSEQITALKGQHAQALAIAKKLALKGAGKTKVKNFKESTDFLADLEF